METLTPDQRPESWGQAAGAYERRIVRLTAPFARAALDRIELQPSERLLDVAAGPGTASFLAAERGASVLAIDYAPEMIERLRERIEREGTSNLQTAVMDGQALDLEGDSFDAAVAVFGLMFFPDQAAGFREMHRVLRPGGRIAVMTWAGPEANPGISLQREAIMVAIPDFPAPTEPPAVFSLSDPDHLRDLASSAGFVDVSVETVNGEWTFDSPDGIWELRDASPVLEAISGIIGDRVEAVHRELTRIVSERFGSGEITVPAEALLTFGRKR